MNNAENSSIGKPIQPLLAVAMATYNPRLPAFAGQIESLKAQSYRNWRCVISDDCSADETLAEMKKIIRADNRFVLSVAPQRLGFYYNFERALSLIPEQAEYVALADQDDFWYPDKLETLLSNFDDETTLVYSDMRIVNAAGKTISETFWVQRPSNCTDLAAMLLTNSVTGASAVFRRSVLELALPLPDRIGDLHHDHWIACVALAAGKLKWVNRPLYDYIQHDQNVTGFGEPVGARPLSLTTFYNDLPRLKTAEGREMARQIYFNQVLKIAGLAQALDARCGKTSVRQKRFAIRRMAKLDTSLLSAIWLTARGVKRGQSANLTGGAEFHVLLGICWSFLSRLKRWLVAKRPIASFWKLHL